LIVFKQLLFFTHVSLYLLSHTSKCSRFNENAKAEWFHSRRSHEVELRTQKKQVEREI